MGNKVMWNPIAKNDYIFIKDMDDVAESKDIFYGLYIWSTSLAQQRQAFKDIRP